MILLYVLLIVVSMLSCLIILYFLKINIIDKQIKKQLENSEINAKAILDKAKIDAEALRSDMILSAREEIHKFKENAEKEYYERYKDIQLREKKIEEKENNLLKKSNDIDSLEVEVKSRMEDAEKKLKELENIKNEQVSKLEKISKMSSSDAKKKIMKLLDKELNHEKALSIFNFKEKLESEKEKISKNIIANAILKCSCEYVSENSISVVRLPSDEIKGCIIGREGRNIRAIETLAGVDLIVDDTPETIAISSFDPYKRAIAKKAIELLIFDGRIQPSKIEEMVEKAKSEINKNIHTEGQKAILDLQICEIHSDLIDLIGKLKYRSSYGQNALQHSIEVAYISGFLASEMHLDESLAKRCGLLHDIGKSLTYEVEGSHVDVGVKVLTRYSESPEVINTVASHHGGCEPESAIAIIVQAADTISASRPGARKENLENYIKRIQKLESLVQEFDFVERCYAIQAGREIRVIVSPEKISDDEMIIFARDICKKIEENLSYPGQIRVNMIRESRVVEYAK